MSPRLNMTQQDTAHLYRARVHLTSTRASLAAPARCSATDRVRPPLLRAAFLCSAVHSFKTNLSISEHVARRILAALPACPFDWASALRTDSVLTPAKRARRLSMAATSAIAPSLPPVSAHSAVAHVIRTTLSVAD